MKTYAAKVDDGGGDEDWVEVDAESLLDAAQKFWDEWHTTGWQWAVVGRDDEGWIDVDLHYSSRRPQPTDTGS